MDTEIFAAYAGSCLLKLCTDPWNINQNVQKFSLPIQTFMFLDTFVNIKDVEPTWFHTLKQLNFLIQLIDENSQEALLNTGSVLTNI